MAQPGLGLLFSDPFSPHILSFNILLFSEHCTLSSGLGMGLNRIQTLPDELEALTQLKHLRLGYNRISGFRGNIYLICSLETLDLGHNR